jgi:Chaperone of endosialidase
MKKSIPLVLITVSLVSFALLPNAHAVVPAPDGGYAGGNTAEGQSALLSLTSGTFNTAVGFLSLRSDTEGQFNTAVGAGALLANEGRPTTNQGIENTAVGAGALLSNTTASFNTADGAFALFSNTTGLGNTANGFQALHHNTTGSGNTAIGDGVLLTNSTGSVNTAEGLNALGFNSTGSENTAVGNGALGSNTTGSSNTALGIGAGSNVTTANNVICIGAEGNNVDNSCYIGNIFGSTSSNGVAVLVNSNGRLGTMTSSARFKDNIKPMDKASESILALKPVSFRYKKEIDAKGMPQFGLIAEEVAKVNPALVLPDKEGKPYTVRYDAVNAMLLNEFLKAHQRIEEQDKRIEKLTAQLKEQAAQIQKVSAQLEATKTATQVVNNP